jgi:hypothetical protein
MARKEENLPFEIREAFQWSRKELKREIKNYGQSKKTFHRMQSQMPFRRELHSERRLQPSANIMSEPPFACTG